MNRTFKVTWVDNQDILHEQTFAVDETAVSSEQIQEIGEDVAEHSRFGVNYVLRVMPCYTGGAPREIQ